MTKKLKLTIDLVPASSWNQNLRSLLKPKMWENLRKETYKKYKFRCAFCKSQGRLHAHEVWDYDDKNYVQKLVNIIALCSKCHEVKHIGFAGIQSSKGNLNYESLVKHFMMVNNCSRDIFKKHYNETFEKFEKRSHYDWTPDLSLLERF